MLLARQNISYQNKIDIFIYYRYKQLYMIKNKSQLTKHIPIVARSFFGTVSGLVRKNTILVGLCVTVLVSGVAYASISTQKSTDAQSGLDIRGLPNLQPEAKGDSANGTSEIVLDHKSAEENSIKANNDSLNPSSTSNQKATTQTNAKNPSNSTPAQSLQETSEQANLREYRNLHQAYYSLSKVPTRSESGGFIYYTVTMQVNAFDEATFGNPTMYIQLTPAPVNQYSCANPSGTIVKFEYGTQNNTASISCKVRACPECYYPGGPLPYYGAFGISVGGLINGVPTSGAAGTNFDLSPGYDKPS